MIYIVTIWDRLFISFFYEIRTCVPLSFLFVICFFLFKCLYQARKVSGHACILGVSILHLSIILIVILESCWYCFDFINWHLTMLCYSWPFVGFRHVTPVCTWSKTTDTTLETGTAYPSGASELPSVLNGFRDIRSLVFCVVFCRSLYVLCLLTIASFFFLVTVLSVLRFANSGYPFGILKLLFHILSIPLCVFNLQI